MKLLLWNRTTIVTLLVGFYMVQRSTYYIKIYNLAHTKTEVFYERS